MAKKRRNASLQAAKARYDAAGTGRRMAGWNTPSSGPNTAITGLQKIRDRVRDVVRNEWSGAANVRVWTTNIVGTGIIPRPRTQNSSFKGKLSKLWNRWVRVADADQVLDFYGLQALVVRSWFTSGECFIRERPRRMSDGLPVPFQIQVLEADMVPLLDADTYAGMPAGNYIRQGIEFDQIGRRVAYWMWKNHPGDKQPANILANMLSRVPASAVCHVFEPLRPGQIRGVSEMAAIITKLKNVADFDDALLERQRLANLFTMFVTRAMPSGANDPMTGMAYQGTADEPIAALEPGTSQELLPGEDVKFSDPPDAGASYAEFMRTQLLGVSAGSGTPYELLSGDLKDVSDRTLRIAINEFRRLCEQRQWLLFIPQMCQPVRDMWANYAFIAGLLTLEEAEEAKDVRWSPQGWAYIHPVQDVQARALEVENGFRSRDDVISERGEDPETVDQERADAKKREDKLGLTPPPPPAPNADPAKQKQADQQEKKEKAANALLERTLALLEEDNG